jgi:hypothetical protein
MAGSLCSAVGLVVWLLAGPAGLLYLLVLTLATMPGWPIGWALFGRQHAAGWIAGSLMGYFLSALAVWAAARLGGASGVGFTFAWLVLCAGAAWFLRIREPMIALPSWSRRDTAGLFAVLILVPALVGLPFLNLGAQDHEGVRHYRAYFTADFFWHVALTDELIRFNLPPANPYAADLALNYYWTYFLVPAAILKADVLPTLDVETAIKLNHLCAGLLFVGMILISAWRLVPRLWPPAVAVVLTLVAASAEGAYTLWDLHSHGLPLSGFRTLNVDAITNWFLKGLTIDGLPRSLWYTPQHAMACSFGLIALLAAGSAQISLGGAMLAGAALAGAVASSPFLGGAFCLIYGVAVVVGAIVYRRPFIRTVAPHAGAALMALVGLGWCVSNQMLEGARGVLQVGFTGHAENAPILTAVLAIGPVLLPALVALARPWRLPEASMPAVAALLIGLGLFYFVSIAGTDPIWVAWRAGQILLVTLPGLGAVFIAQLSTRPVGRAACGLLVTALLAIGLPTTLLDWYNAQDITNREMGPGFPWTVRITPAQQAAFEWIRQQTPEDAVVQMDTSVRGRASWTHIPTFARRRMAAGLPISLVTMPYYQTRSQSVRELYGTTDPRRAWTIARTLKIDYIYVDDVERNAFGASAIAKFDRNSAQFMLMYRNADVAIYAVAD